VKANTPDSGVQFSTLAPDVLYTYVAEDNLEFVLNDGLPLTWRPKADSGERRPRAFYSQVDTAFREANISRQPGGRWEGKSLVVIKVNREDFVASVCELRADPIITADDLPAVHCFFSLSKDDHHDHRITVVNVEGRVSP